MNKRIYISVILPLKLDWDPCYWTDDETITVGTSVSVKFAGKLYTGVVSAVGIAPQTAPAKILPIIETEKEFDRVLPEEIMFWRQIADYYLCSVGEVYKIAAPARKQSWKEAPAKKASSGKAASSPKPETRAEVVLSEIQEKAVERIHSAFNERKTVLLNGVTGSGKTEIYIHLASEALAKGKNVLYMIPEIAMSRQLEDRLRQYFANRLLTYHSGETPKHRSETVRAVRNGGEPCRGEGSEGGYVVLGTRSAIFLPHNNLGLIVVDEEHDSSYKQDAPSPRYNGRDAAIMLCRTQNTIHDRLNAGEGRTDSARPGCNIILGSATPSISSIYNCRSGKFFEVRLEQPYYGEGKVEVEIIDTIAERKKRGMNGAFSKKLIDRIRAALQGKGQVMLLRARRGYFPVLQCVECGYIPKCPKCNVSLNFHKDSGRTVCHRCGYTKSGMSICPECGSTLKGLGAGTQKIEEEAAALFPQAAIARLDSDATAKAKETTAIIKKFSRGEIDILIGTQIVTKGFDFSRLSLVAVLQADTLLGSHDFNADEKALQTLVQFRGRCARRGAKGLFVIQTAIPEHPVYLALAAGSGENQAASLDSFYARLLSERAEFGYPPYTRIIDITLKDKIEERADRMAGSLAAALSDFDITGPVAPASGMDSGEYVRTIRVTLPKDRSLQDKKAGLEKIVSVFETGQKYTGHITVNVDPA